MSKSSFTVNVMKAVAHNTDGPEPLYDIAEKWLERHSDHLVEAMEAAAKDYIRQNWSK